MTPTLQLRSLVRAVFITGATVSMLDALTTWLAFRHTGLAGEGLPWMATAMDAIGTAPVLVLRFVIGTVAIWFLARRVIRAKPGWLARFRYTRWIDAHGAALSLVLAVAITAGVVGNNVHALVLLDGAS